MLNHINWFLTGFSQSNNMTYWSMYRFFPIPSKIPTQRKTNMALWKKKYGLWSSFHLEEGFFDSMLDSFRGCSGCPKLPWSFTVVYSVYYILAIRSAALAIILRIPSHHPRFLGSERLTYHGESLIIHHYPSLIIGSLPSIGVCYKSPPIPKITTAKNWRCFIMWLEEAEEPEDNVLALTVSFLSVPLVASRIHGGLWIQVGGKNMGGFFVGTPNVQSYLASVVYIRHIYIC